jgi:branched-chain amino acid transport system ATP-binding protein
MLAIGRALTLNPRVLLLDEPMEGLAPILIRELSDAIRGLALESGMALVLVEQHARLALELTADALVLARGRVIAEGSPEVVRADADVKAIYLG